MSVVDEPTTAAIELRRAAEGIARSKAAEGSAMLEALSPEATRSLLHELEVHQIELELQNEELRNAHTELSTARARYFELYDLAPAGYCSVSEKGLILEANLAFATLLDLSRSAVHCQPFSTFIHWEDQNI